ncbi:MAG TPA: hypothetical protein VN364_08450 [Bellilinea sp.]|nr:hypothetical protein [Bellilinea sp.]
MDINRLDILQKIETGEVTPEEGLRLLNAVDGNSPVTPDRMAFDSASVPDVEILQPRVASQAAADKANLPEFSKYRTLSWLMFGAFLILTLVSANWMVQGWLANNFGWGFWLAWIPFGIGVLGMATSLNSRWLHLRVTDTGNGRQKNIRISMPLPLGLASWVLNAVPGWLPREVREKHIGEALSEINHSVSRDEPFFIAVDEDNQHVEIYIG